MFPTQQLFRDIVCPQLHHCKLTAAGQSCLFSHHHIAASSTLPQKRSSSSTNAAAASGTASLADSTAALRVHKMVKHEAAASSNGSSNAHASSSKLSDAVYNSTPRLSMSIRTSHTPINTRNAMLKAIHAQFVLSYADLPLSSRNRLAYEHAMEQEAENFRKANKSTYRNLSISCLARLKKRPKATRDLQHTGTLEEEQKRVRESEEREKGRLTRAKVERYLSTKEVLAKWDYLVEEPEGVGGDRRTSEGEVAKCERSSCGVEFLVQAELDENEKIACAHHFGRLVTEKLGGIKQRVFSCCPSQDALPCQRGPHVFRDTTSEQLHSRVAFASTSSLATSPTSAHEVIALDCELVYTTSGMSLARLTVVDVEGSIILDEHVRPTGSLLDTNFRFSGVTDEHLQSAKLDIVQVRDKLAALMNERTIIVGHGLENDLKAIRLIHLNCIDTAIIFPHPRGHPFRHALRSLTRDHLGKFIQQDGVSLGHSATDDAISALELLRWKMLQHV